MKRTIAIIVVALAAVGFAQAAQFNTNPSPADPPSGVLYVPDVPNITQSVDPSTVVSGSVACSDGAFSADNWFLRRFFLNADHGITVQYNVTSVDFGIEAVNVYIGTTAPITISTYSLANGAGFTFGNMTQLDTVTRNIPDGAALVIENFPITGSIVDPVGSDLVVTMFYPDVTATGDFGVWPGSNSSGELQPSYLASVSCELAEPATLASIGFPNMHLVVTVNGDEQVIPTPTPPPPSTAIPVPSLNTYGIVAMVLMLTGVAVLVMRRRS